MGVAEKHVTCTFSHPSSKLFINLYQIAHRHNQNYSIINGNGLEDIQY